ncbi:MAG TPA: substrate-binding domain-containing protein [Rhizomicrobium sp.]|jgi:molybdate transport system substrate-binding protein|nr:substrate-binding domain-containing protein [Rhizomicrobium sp.]
MRAILIAVAMAMLASQARAAEIQVRCPALVHDAMEDFAAGFQRQTGTEVTVISGPMGKMVDAIQTAAAPPDVVILPPGLMDLLAMQGGVKGGTRAPLVQVDIGLAVPAGAAKPDISSVERLRTALLGAKAVTYTKPGPPRFSMEAQMIDSLLKQPQFSGVHALPAPSGSGVGFLAAGHADMAMQVVPEILATKGIVLVGPLPAALDMHIDVAASVFAHAQDAADASAFIAYITRSEAEQVWLAQGITRN